MRGAAAIIGLAAVSVGCAMERLNAGIIAFGVLLLLGVVFPYLLSPRPTAKKREPE